LYAGCVPLRVGGVLADLPYGGGELLFVEAVIGENLFGIVRLLLDLRAEVPRSLRRRATPRPTEVFADAGALSFDALVDDELFLQPAARTSITSGRGE